MPKDLVYNIRINAPKDYSLGNDVSQQNERAEKSIKDVTQEIRNQIRFLDLQREKGSVTAQELTQEYGRLERQLEELPQSFKGTVRAQEKLLGAQRRLGGASQNFSKAQSNANQVLFSFGDIANDAQQFSFGAAQGMRAIGNNIGFVTEQFANTAQRAGGFKGAIKALGGSLLGPGGLILGINLAVSAITIFGDKLFGAKNKASEFNEEIKQTTDFLRELSEAAVDDFIDQAETLEEKIAAVDAAMQSVFAGGEDPIKLMRQNMQGFASSAADATNIINGGLAPAAQDVLDTVSQQEIHELRISAEVQQILINKKAELEAQKLINKFAKDHLNTVKETGEEQKESVRSQIEQIQGVDTTLISGEIITSEQRSQIEEAKKQREEQAQQAKELANNIKGAYVESGQSVREAAGLAMTSTEMQAESVRDTLNRISTVAGIAGQAVQTLFGESKAAAIASAIINGAQAITKTYTLHGFSPLGVAAAAAQAAATAAQIAKIKRTEIGSSGDSGAADVSAPSQGFQTREREVSQSSQTTNLRSTSQASMTRQSEKTTVIVEANNVLPDTEFSVRSERGRRKREKRAQLVGD